MQTISSGYFLRDLSIVALSIVAAVVLSRSGTFEQLIATTQDIGFVGSFIAGLLFTSIFTSPLATVALGEIAQHAPLLEVAVLGGIGALVADLLIFLFIRDSVSADLGYVLKLTGSTRRAALFRSKLLRRLMPFLGALVIASPLPDELGIAMLGLSHTSMHRFIPFSFVANTVGILVIGWVARGL